MFNEEYFSNGKVPLLFYEESGNSISINDTTPIFYLKLLVKDDFKLKINSSITQKEAIDYNYSQMDINMYKKLLSCEKPLIYPNPFLNELMIDISNTEFTTPLSVSVYSVDGREIFTNVIHDQFYRFKNSELNKFINGIYFIKITDENCSKVIRVIKD